MKRLLLVFLALTISVGAEVCAASDPDTLVRQLYDDWVNKVRSNHAAIEADRRTLYTLTAESAGPYIDFNRLSRLVLGKYWRQATPVQQERFVAEFRNHLIRTYATAMYQYVDAAFILKPTKYKPTDRHVIVRTETKPNDGRPKFPVNYVLAQNNSGWQAIDVVVEGVSTVSTLRGIVNSEVQTKTLDGVIAELTEKNRQAML